MRKKTNRINVGSLPIGDFAPISVQSMGNRSPYDKAAILAQITEVAEAGCEIMRLTIPDEDAAKVFAEVKQHSPIPLIADIHFKYKLALLAVEAGADGLRINPGNIGSREGVAAVVAAAKERNISIRIGVNAGSLSRKMVDKHGGATVAAMVESALEHIHILEDLNFDLIKVSIKASDVNKTVEAYRQLSAKVNYPLHVGISEAGSAFGGTIKSSIGIGLLLAEGIGDTIRVSLTADPVLEVRTAFEILKALDIRRISPEIISCPTCGRCEIDLFSLASRVEEKMLTVKKPVKVAIMGCVVNGPGEAKEADIGIAGGDGFGIIFRGGKILRKENEENLYNALIEEIEKL